MERIDDALTLTTSEAAQLLDVHASTVKRWCNDGELSFDKTSGGHRRIRLEDALLFSEEQGIDTVLAPFHPYEAHVWTALQGVREGSYRRFLSLAMSWVHRGKLRHLSALYQALAPEVPEDPCPFLDQGVRGLMERVGTAWREGRLRVGEEHMVSQVMFEVLLKLRDGLPSAHLSTEAPARVAVVGTLEGNQHHLGSLCVRLLLELRGWEVHYLGPDVPVEDFAVIQRGRRAHLVCVSLAPPAAPGDVTRAVRILHRFREPGLPFALAFGGAMEDEVADDAWGDLSVEDFTDVGVFESCGAFSAALDAGFAGTLSGMEEAQV